MAFSWLIGLAFSRPLTTEPNGHNQTGDKIHKTYQNMLVLFKGFSYMIYIFELSNPPDIEPIRKHQPATHLGRIIGLMPADRSDGQASPSCRSFASSWWRTWVSSPPSLPRSFVMSTFSPAPQPGVDGWCLDWRKMYIPIGSMVLVMYGIYANIWGILMGSMLPYI